MLDLLSLLGIAVGLAMDAFAVSMAMGFALPRIRTNQALRLALAFGGFQFLMPVVGYLAAATIARHPGLTAWDHWIAFVLLVGLGAKMIHDARQESQEDPAATPNEDPTKSIRLLLLAIVTSLDALAVGVSLGLLQVTILLPSTLIGLTAAGFSVVGLHLGHRFGGHLGRHADILGGLALMAIGARILHAHLMAPTP
ncbi:MAG: manganese efflux pump MntP family protein [Candidatus Sericytochromatia bacterium]|nr:manganese efflux pump MntP family protein [Candidatus Sericytochromatia bacterium]